MPASDVHRVARLFADRKGVSIYQRTCVQDQTANGTQKNCAFSVLQIITGNINNPRGRVIVRVYLANVGMADGEPLGAKQCLLFYEIRGKKNHFIVVTCVPENIPEKIKSIPVIAGNLLVSMLDSNAFSREEFKKPELLVVCDLFVTGSGVLAHCVLPVCSYLEK